MKGPVELAIDIESPNSGLGQNVTVTVTVSSIADLQNAKLVLSSEGGIYLDSETNIPAVSSGNPYTFTANAQLNALGDNAIKVLFTGVTDEGFTTGMKLNKYGFVESNRSFFSYGSNESVKRTRLKYMKEHSEISNKEFKNQMEDLRRIRVTPSVKKKGTNTKSATINISGTIRWQDGAGNFHPLPSAEVEIYDEDLVFDDLLASLVTNSMGQYTANVDEQTFDDLDIYVKVYARNATNGFYIVPGETSGNPMSFSDAYFGEVSGGEVTSDTDISFDLLNTSAQPFSFHHGLIMCTDYINMVNGSYLSSVAVEFPGMRTTNSGALAGAFYSFSAGLIHMPGMNVYDWDVLHHEYGHHVMNVFNFEDSPGGSHFIGEHLSDSRGKEDGVKLAWAEGYPTYLGLSLQQEMNAAALNIPLIGDLNYDDTRIGLNYNIEGNISPVSEGEDDELAVQKILWDIYDSNSDNNDNLNLGHNDLWNRISNSSAVSLSDAWGTLTNNRPANDIQPYAEIFADFDVPPEPTAPANDMMVMSSDPPVKFTWTANGGGGTCCPNNSFEVAFYNSSWVLIHRSAPITSTSMPLTLEYTPSASEWTTITDPANAPTVHWVVEGSSTMNFVDNTDIPFLTTGPYHSPARKLMLPGLRSDYRNNISACYI